MFRNPGGECFRIHHDLPLIIAELWLERLMKTNSFGCDHMHERTALHPGEYHRIDFLRAILPAHHNAAARTAQTLMRRRGDEVSIRNWTWMLPAGHQPGNMRHVDK